ncbi:MAG: hypothetical protein WC188_11525 [Candidatus Caldatribacteriota bacterium]|nr:hypothetical protein [Patescibacteria group bacterium]
MINSKFKRKVALMGEFKDSIMYTVDCDCGSEECRATIDIEIDQEFKIIILNFYKTLNCSTFSYIKDSKIKQLFANIKKRFYYAFKIFFTGEISLNSDLIISKKDHIDNFIDALQEGRDYCFDRLEFKD